jgi:hypothetical protein
LISLFDRHEWLPRLIRMTSSISLITALIRQLSILARDLQYAVRDIEVYSIVERSRPGTEIRMVFHSKGIAQSL